MAKPKNHGANWTPKDEDTLIEMNAQGCSFAFMANQLGRTEKSIEMKLETLAYKIAVESGASNAEAMEAFNKQLEASKTRAGGDVNTEQGLRAERSSDIFDKLGSIPPATNPCGEINLLGTQTGRIGWISTPRTGENFYYYTKQEQEMYQEVVLVFGQDVSKMNQEQLIGALARLNDEHIKIYDVIALDEDSAFFDAFCEKQEKARVAIMTELNTRFS